MTCDKTIVTDNLAIFRPMVICLQSSQFNWVVAVFAVCPAMYWNQAHCYADDDDHDDCDNIFHYGYLFC